MNNFNFFYMTTGNTFNVCHKRRKFVGRTIFKLIWQIFPRADSRRALLGSNLSLASQSISPDSKVFEEEEVSPQALFSSGFWLARCCRVWILLNHSGFNLQIYNKNVRNFRQIQNNEDHKMFIYRPASLTVQLAPFLLSRIRESFMQSISEYINQLKVF